MQSVNISSINAKNGHITNGSHDSKAYQTLQILSKNQNSNSVNTSSRNSRLQSGLKHKSYHQLSHHKSHALIKSERPPIKENSLAAEAFDFAALFL